MPCTIAENTESRVGLGVFAISWHAWDKEESRIKTLSPAYFLQVAQAQLVEISTHLLAGSTVRANKEWVDMIGVSLNALRAQGLSRYDIDALVRQRVMQRYNTQTTAILDKYQGME
jgi:hypothetical protein